MVDRIRRFAAASRARFDGQRLSAAPPDAAAGAPAAVRVVLFGDEKEEDREIALEDVDLDALDERALLWIDVSDLEQVERATTGLPLTPDTVSRVALSPARVDVVFETAYFHVSVVVAERTPLGYQARSLHCLAGENWIVTAHDVPLDFLQHFSRRIRGDSRLGRLNAAGLVAVFLHEHLASYRREVEPFELELDRLDLRVIAGRADDGTVLQQLVDVRRRLARLRHLFAPHRDLYARLARPDFELLSNSGSPDGFASLAERGEQALQALDTTREMIVSSFEIYTTFTAHETNKVMKLLTIASVTLLPPTLLASVMGMNSLPHALFGVRSFAFTLTAMLALVAGVLATAHRRGWI